MLDAAPHQLIFYPCVQRSFPFSYGIFLDFYTINSTFEKGSSTSLALVGSLSSGVLYLTSPIVLPIINRYPWHKRHAMTLGVFLCVSGLIGAAFSTKVWHLIITQGVMYSIGGSKSDHLLAYGGVCTHLLCRPTLFPNVVVSFRMVCQEKGPSKPVSNSPLPR